MKWIQYTVTPDIDLLDFEKVHIGDSGGDYVLRSIAQPDKYMKMDQGQVFKSLLDKHTAELLSKARALVARMEAEPPWVGDRNSMHVKGLPDSINPKKPPRNYRDAMSREDKHELAEAYMAEYQRFLTQGTLKRFKPKKGAKVLDTTTSADYKVTNGVFDKRKLRLCVCGNQQEEGVHYNSGDLYAREMEAKPPWVGDHN